MFIKSILLFSIMEKFLQVKSIILPPIEYNTKGDMSFFTALFCYLHLYPQNVKFVELPDYDIDNPPNNKLVIHVSNFEKWNGYEIYYPVYTNLQCKYCSETVVSEIIKMCKKFGIGNMYKQLSSEFAKMVYVLFGIKVETTKTLLEMLSEDEKK